MWSKLKGWKTMLLHGVSFAIVALGEVLQYLGAFDWSRIVDPATAMKVLLVINVVSIVLRAKTTGPIGSKE